MQVTTSSFEAGKSIPAQFAFCDIDAETHATFSGNINPQLAWSDVPDGTQSFAIICHDPDVPSAGDDVNQEGREVPSDLPRVDFYHWLLANISADTREIAAGSHAEGVTAKGKSGPAGPQASLHGANDYTSWFAGDADMGGDYFGYDGPCPPWNDSIIHHYHFTVYALDVPSISLDGPFQGADLLAAIEGHILGSGSVMGTYTLNPALR